MTEFNSEAYVGATKEMEPRPQHRSDEDDCGPKEHIPAAGTFTQQPSSASYVAPNKPCGDATNHSNQKESVDKVVNDVNLNKAYQAYRMACRQRDSYKEQLEKTMKDVQLYKYEAEKLQAQLNAKQEFGKQVKCAEEDDGTLIQDHYAEARPYEQIYNVCTEVSQSQTHPFQETFKTKFSSAGERRELEDAYKELQEEFKKLHMVVRKQSNLLRSFLRPKSPLSHAESIPIQCTDMEDSIQVTAYTRLPHKINAGLPAVDNSLGVMDHHKKTITSYGSIKGTSIDPNMECRNPLAVLAAVSQADDSLLTTVESLSTLGLKRPPADMEYLENLISKDDDLTCRRVAGHAHEVGNFSFREHCLIESMELLPDSSTSAGVVPGIAHEFGASTVNASLGCIVPKKDNNPHQILQGNVLGEICLNSPSSEESQFFFRSQQLVDKNYFYEPSDDNLR